MVRLFGYVAWSERIRWDALEAALPSLTVTDAGELAWGDLPDDDQAAREVIAAVRLLDWTRPFYPGPAWAELEEYAGGEVEIPWSDLEEFVNTPADQFYPPRLLALLGWDERGCRGNEDAGG